MPTEVPAAWALVEAFATSEPDDAARVVEELPEDVAGALLDDGPPAVSALIMSRLALASATAALEACTPERAGAIVERLPGDRAAAMLRRLEEGPRAVLIERLDRESAASVRRALSYPDDTAGGFMDPRVLALPEDLTVRAARRYSRRHGRQGQDDLWVVSRDDVLVGAIPLGVLVLSEGRVALRDLADRNVGRIGPRAGRPAVLAHPAWDDRSSLPVVDEAGRLLGVIPASTRRRLRGLTVSSRGPAGPIAVGLAVGELYCITAARLLGAILSGPAASAEEPR